MWSRCSPNSIHRLACSTGGRFPVASTALHRMISIDAVVAVCSASKRVALTVVYLFCLTALMITGTVCCRCFTADTTSCLLAVRLFADCCPPASDWMVHVFVCCHLWSVCVPCRTSSAWLTVACVTDYLTSSFLVQQFQWVIKWDCRWAKSPAVIFLWRSQRLLSAHRTACVTVWGPNGCSLPVCSNVCLRLAMKLAFSCTAVFLSLSHSNVCPSTGQCPNGLSCFPSLSLCKYSGSPSDFTRSRQRSVHACLNATTHARHSVNVCLYLSSFFPSPPHCDSISQTLRILKWLN